jgi:serine/threonine protein kinase/formylglycine-generating enzyme required for sulfatase activity
LHSCPAINELKRLLDETFGEPERARLEAHVESCQSCMEILVALVGEAGEGLCMPPLLPRASTPNGTHDTPDGTAGHHKLPKIADYVLVRVLGRGGVGVVYLARQLLPPRLVAVKVLLAGKHASSSDVARFRTETEAMARLQHPNIVSVFEVGEEDGQPFFAMEYVDGGSLQDSLPKKLAQPCEAARLVRALAEAIHYAHQRGVIHRDLKPSNILFARKEGVGASQTNHDTESAIASALWIPKIMDFGLARILDADQSRQSRTAPNSPIGTPSYMAPEQATGNISAIGVLTDVHALGAVLYTVLTQRVPYEGNSDLEIILKVGCPDILPPSPRTLRPSLDKDLDTICMKSMAKDPNSRYRSALDLAEDLQAFLENRPIKARRTPLWERAWKWTVRRPAAAVTVLGGLLIAITSVIAAASIRVHLQGLQADSLLQSLLTADMEHVPLIINQLRKYQGQAEPRLRSQESRLPDASEARLRLMLALSAFDSKQTPHLCDRLLKARSGIEFRILRDTLKDQSELAAPALWNILERTNADGDQRLRAAATLAQWDAKDHRWQAVASPVSDLLVSQSPTTVLAWSESLLPISKLLIPPLRSTFRDAAQPTVRRTNAASVLADFLAVDFKSLVELLIESGPAEFPLFLSKLPPETGIPLLRNVPALRIAADSNEPLSENQIRQAALAGIALFQLGATDVGLQFLDRKPDPRLRYSFIHLLRPLQTKSALILTALRSESHPAQLAGLLSALGDYEPSDFPKEMEKALDLLLRRIHLNHPDSEVHSVAGWLWSHLNHGKTLPLPNQVNEKGFTGGNPSYTTINGHSFVLVPQPEDFMMGSPLSEPDRAAPAEHSAVGEETQIRLTLRPFAIGTTEVTLKEFLRFKPKHSQPGELTPLVPVSDVDFVEIAMYCNWLSLQDGLPPDEYCFAITDTGGIKRANPFPNASRRMGYRVPTEAEWEYACRAGTSTKCFFGDTAEWLPKYGWFLVHSEGHLWPVATLRPNQLGLFDMLGNASEWCLRSREDAPPGHAIVRGGNALEALRFARAARRVITHPQWRRATLGFRLARTLPLK